MSSASSHDEMLARLGRAVQEEERLVAHLKLCRNAVRSARQYLRVSRARKNDLLDQLLGRGRYGSKRVTVQ